ncbi:hypothetical protein F4054_23070 [Candidatus Poribacteria bacterium]|nr:hypothetical protein [Candidatus Poribacteria bacterium]MYG08581.1 hypothetical protein [Candidatus Poribacteria bacterium]MYK25135.1 hypothetical protein [Candidatus Poribacteria bacterium]
MKHIHIFGIVLLVAFLAAAVDAVACENFEEALDRARKSRDAVQKELDLRKHQTGLIDSFIKRLDNDDDWGLDDWEDDLDDINEHLAYKDLAESDKLADAEAAVASAQADLDNCLELTEKVNDILYGPPPEEPPKRTIPRPAPATSS